MAKKSDQMHYIERGIDDLMIMLKKIEDWADEMDNLLGDKDNRIEELENDNRSMVEQIEDLEQDVLEANAEKNV